MLCVVRILTYGSEDWIIDVDDDTKRAINGGNASYDEYNNWQDPSTRGIDNMTDVRLG